MLDITQKTTRARHRTVQRCNKFANVSCTLCALFISRVSTCVYSYLVIAYGHVNPELFVKLLVTSTSQILQSLHLANFATIFQALFNSVPIDKITETISFVSSHNKQNITS